MVSVPGCARECVRALAPNSHIAGSYLQRTTWGYLPASLLNMNCGASPFMMQLNNAPEFSLADGVYVATTTMHLERTVYLKMTSKHLDSFPKDVIPPKQFECLKTIVSSNKKRQADRLLVPTANGYCVQTQFGKYWWWLS